MDQDCRLLIIGYDVSFVIIHGEMQRIESGLISEKFYEINGLLQVVALFVGIDYGAVDIDESVSQVVAQALSAVSHEIQDCYTYDDPQQSYQREKQFPMQTCYMISRHFYSLRLFLL